MRASSPCVSRSDLRRAPMLPGYSGGTAGLAGDTTPDGAYSPAASSLFSLIRGHLAGVAYSVSIISHAASAWAVAPRSGCVVTIYHNEQP